ncbi:MAG: hypothetical protein KME07_08055 [Pegethrix bostrychoides GSE-TBD4-15B]|uniref:Uncharacterized protein n=1 Tax=Pegethrix bostrychoides GSE-TBD4-15B TaxID=2839662 RepID=A0A951P9Y4_9CYAN|nr:hypothetical protein [Pegethrix bostrychoides GSE-TBD4-15B]
MIEEYKKFLFLAIVADHPVTSLNAVDQAWHLHRTSPAIDPGMLANFQNNRQLIEWVNQQPLAYPAVCLGDMPLVWGQ